jgi:predicted phosphodiesterase
MTARWTIEERARNIHVIETDLSRKDDELRVLLQSDVHWDNPMCDRKLFHKHLKEALKLGAPVLDNGDFFCAMQGKWDKRANKSDLRPEHQTTRYLDSLVETAVAELEPYKHLLCVRGRGNHEASILKHHETDLIERLTERLRVAGSKTIHTGGYSGYVVFRVQVSTRHYATKLHYFHGAGGGGPVTRGVIQTNRHAVYLADADVVWAGHTHDQYVLRIARVRLNNELTAVNMGEQIHVRTPGYKEEYQDGYGGFHVERGAPPKPVGAAWLSIKNLGSESVRGRKTDLIEVNVTEAR